MLLAVAVTFGALAAISGTVLVFARIFFFVVVYETKFDGEATEATLEVDVCLARDFV